MTEGWLVELVRRKGSWLADGAQVLEPVEQGVDSQAVTNYMNLGRLLNLSEPL